VMDKMKNENGKKLLGELRDELYAEVARSDSRLEMDRRRLVARIGRKEPERAPRKGLIVGLSLGAAVAAAALALFVLIPIEEQAPPRPISLSGLWRVDLGDAVSAGSEIRVPPNAGAKLVMKDRTTFWLGASTRASMKDGDPSTITLTHGRMLTVVTPRKAGSGLTVKTPLGNVRVHGTTLSILVDGESMRVRLHEGTVDVISNGETIPVSPGHQVEVRRGAALVVSPVDRAGVLADLMITEKTADLDGPPVPRIDPAVEKTTKKAKDRLDPVIDRKPTAEPPDEKRDPQISVRNKPKNDPAADSISEVVEEEVIEEKAIEEEVLFTKAYVEAQAGNLSTGRKLLEEYLSAHPDGRYWQRVVDILGEEASPP
jgi:FecR-like protein